MTDEKSDAMNDACTEGPMLPQDGKHWFSIHLENGSSLTFRATDVDIIHDDGNVIGYQIHDGEGDVPTFINPRAILALTKGEY